MTERESPRWKTGSWAGHPHYECTLCQFTTFDAGEIRIHARERHPLESEGGGPQHPLAGIQFATDAAAKAAIKAKLTARAFDQITPSGKTGGYTLADVRSAARTTDPET